MTEGFNLPHPCDYPTDDDPRCGETPTKYVGDIYYACPDHYSEMENMVEG